MMLVLDITKGMQTQTAECLVIGQITCKKMVVVLNKVDLVPEVKRQATIEKVLFNTKTFDYFDITTAWHQNLTSSFLPDQLDIVSLLNV